MVILYRKINCLISNYFNNVRYIDRAINAHYKGILVSNPSLPRWQVKLYSSPAASKKKQDVEKKEHCNVGTIGHVDHGKTTLTAAITQVLSKMKMAAFVPFDKIDQAPQEKLRGITINTAHVGYSTKKRSYAHTDCPGHMDFIKNMISGTSQMDAAILLVAATDGLMPQTREHLSLSKQIGIKQIIVFINKCDVVEQDFLDLVELEMRELLNEFGYDPEKTPFVFGSALLALQGNTESKYGEDSIHRLMQVMDDYVEAPQRDLTSPFLMPIDNFVSVPGRGTVLVGTVKKGTMKKGQESDLLGYGKKIKTSISGMQIFRQDVTTCQAGDNVGVIVRGIKKDVMEKGMTLAAYRSASLHNRFEATIFLVSSEEGGRKRAIPARYIQMIHSDTWNINCRFDLPPGVELLMPGERGTMHCTLLYEMALYVGMRFQVREMNATIATGVITKMLPSVEIQKKRLTKIDFSKVIKTR